MAIRVNMLIGCTASGKSAVGIELARRLGGEIVSIDSMKIYRRMDVGTAKPPAAIRTEIPHHMIDVVEPSESFSLARYVEGAEAAVRDIASREKPVLAVGGTMLYVRGLTAGVFEGPSADPGFRRALRARAEREGTQALHAELARVDPVAASRIHPNDLRRVERALEVFHLTGRPISELQTQWSSESSVPGSHSGAGSMQLSTENSELRTSHFDYRVAALHRPREEASRRINTRVRRMIQAGLVDEVRSLLAEPGGIGPQAAQAVGYAEIIAHLRGDYSLERAVELIKINSRHLAKHQRTWMRRMPDLRAVDVGMDDKVEEVADRVLEAWQREA